VNGKAEDGASPDPKAARERGGGRPEARTRRHKDPSSSSLFEMSKRESFLSLMSVGWDCQADRREGGIIHHREGYSDWRWWIILVASANLLWAGFFALRHPG
jgi:hypothetical protein